MSNSKRNDSDISIYEPNDSVTILTSNKPIESTGRISAFDLDWTLIRPIYGKFPKDAEDYEILPGRKEKLQELIYDGYNLIVVTNQGWTKKVDQENALQRIINFINELDLPIIVFMAKKKDDYRKPNTDMLNLIQKVFEEPIKEMMYVGDAAGRGSRKGEPVDFSDDDIKWAKNISKVLGWTVPFYTPEEFFPRVAPPVKTGKTMAILMGVPGSGKDTFYHQFLEKKGYISISSDQLKTKARFFKVLEDTLKTGNPVAVNATNPGQDKRQLYYDLAKKYGYNVVLYYLVRNGEAWNAARPLNDASKGEDIKKVPPVAYATYYKNLVLPTEDNTPGPIYRIW